MHAIKNACYLWAIRSDAACYSPHGPRPCVRPNSRAGPADCDSGFSALSRTMSDIGRSDAIWARPVSPTISPPALPSAHRLRPGGSSTYFLHLPSRSWSPTVCFHCSLFQACSSPLSLQGGILLNIRVQLSWPKDFSWSFPQTTQGPWSFPVSPFYFLGPHKPVSKNISIVYLFTYCLLLPSIILRTQQESRVVGTWGGTWSPVDDSNDGIERYGIKRERQRGEREKRREREREE